MIKGYFCVDCGRESIVLNGNNPDGSKRYNCSECNSHKKPRITGTTFTEGKDFINVVCASERMLSKEDLIRQFGVDMNLWEEDFYRVKTSEGYRKDRKVKWKVKDGVVTEGDVDDSGKMLVVPLYHVELRLRPKNKTVKQLQESKAQIIKDIKAYKINYPKIKYAKINNPSLLEINIFDLHFGMLSWGQESSGDYDIKIAENLFLDGIKKIVSYAKPFNIERILFPIGNDLFSSDNKDQTTTKGTPQDEDVRWQKSFNLMRKIAVKSIDMLRQIAPVDVVVVPGNHDMQRTFYLGDALECWYNSCPGVTIDNTPRMRKYYMYGSNLIGLTHGNEEKTINLPQIMAQESENWSNTKYREWHLGHFHSKKEIKWISTEEFVGVVVRFLRSLTPPNAWATSKGYVGSVRSAEGFIWSKDNGLIGQFQSNL